jgi:flagellar assembly protein FliH
MLVAQKYLFELSFDPPGTPVEPAPAAAAAEPPAAPAPPPAISPEELSAARAEGFDEGRRAGLAEAAAAQDAATAAALDAIAERLAALAAGLDGIHRDAERAAIAFAHAVAKKFVPTLARRGAVDEAMALAADCLAEAIAEPRIVVRVPDALFEPVRRRLDALKATGGFEGKLVILVDEAMADADCRIEWADGGAERDEARLWREIDAAIQRNFEPRSAPTTGADTTPTGEH